MSALTFRHSVYVRYGIALLAVGLAWGAALLLRDVAPERSLYLVFFFAAVTVSAGFGGFGPGGLATVACALICDYFFLPPYHSLTVAARDLPLLVLFVLVALLINVVSERLWAGARAADQRFHDLVQGLDAIVWEAHPRTLQFTFVSQRAEALLGYPVRQWLDAPAFRATILHPEDRTPVQAALQQALARGGDHAFDYRVLAADGREVWLRETVHVVHDDARQPARVTGLSVDITERKKAAAELAAVKDDLAALNALTAAVGASLERPRVIAMLQQQLTDPLQIAAGAIFVVGKADGRLHLESGWGVSTAELENVRFLPAEVFDSGALIPDAKEATGDTLVSPTPADGLALETTRVGDAEGRAVPLHANGELQGGIYLFAPDPPERDRRSAAFWDALGRQVGVILQNARLFEQVRAGREHLHHLSRQLVQVQEAERREIARELHDEIGQVLTGLKLSLEMSARLPPDAANARLREALTLVNELMTHVHDLSLDLRPAMLDDLGLLPTLLWHFERYLAQTGVRVAFEHSGIERRFPYELETTAYRIVQEALTNVARHARVEAVTVRLWSAHDVLGIQVADQGRGFDPEKAPAGAGGLAGMEERASLLGGRLTVESTPENGTCLTAELPLDDPASANTADGPITRSTRSS